MAARKNPSNVKTAIANDDAKIQMTAKKAQKQMAEKYKKEELVEISISPMYSNEFSKNMPINLNGVRISIPVNGKQYKIPKSFAMEVRQRIALADQKHKRLTRMADVKSNLERSPGELELFR